MLQVALVYLFDVVFEPAFFDLASLVVFAARNPLLKCLLNKISSHITAGSQVFFVNFKFRIAELLSLNFICWTEPVTGLLLPCNDSIEFLFGFSFSGYYPRCLKNNAAQIIQEPVMLHIVPIIGVDLEFGLVFFCFFVDAWCISGLLRFFFRNYFAPFFRLVDVPVTGVEVCMN